MFLPPCFCPGEFNQELLERMEGRLGENHSGMLNLPLAIEQREFAGSQSPGRFFGAASVVKGESRMATGRNALDNA
jgi:hypothetical protein